jgi:hypothetical protein
LRLKRILEVVVLVTIQYNICFIPLQFGFKIPFGKVFLGFEIATVLVYLLEISFCFHTISWYKNLDCVDDDVLRRKDLKIKQSIFFKNK